MFGLETLDVLIGLVTVYLVFGLACTAIVEGIATWLKLRSTNLEEALKEFLAGELTKTGGSGATQPFVDAFYDHPLVQALSKGKEGRPSYIPPEIVAHVVEALLTAGGTVTSLADAVSALPETVATNRIKGLLDALVRQANGDAAAFRKAVETHFDAAMDRASGWVKRRTQLVAFVASIALVVLANVDTVQLATSLAADPAARVRLVEIAEQNVKTADANAVADAKAALQRAVSGMESAGLQFGWKVFLQDPPWSVTKVAGLVVSIFAVSLGAPFWFDVLQRFMQVRAAGVTPREKEEGKK